ncbi:hypothetical protein [Raoultella ornithinolytica]
MPATAADLNVGSKLSLFWRQYQLDAKADKTGGKATRSPSNTLGRVRT